VELDRTPHVLLHHANLAGKTVGQLSNDHRFDCQHQDRFGAHDQGQTHTNNLSNLSRNIGSGVGKTQLQTRCLSWRLELLASAPMTAGSYRIFMRDPLTKIFRQDHLSEALRMDNRNIAGMSILGGSQAYEWERTFSSAADASVNHLWRIILRTGLKSMVMTLARSEWLMAVGSSFPEVTTVISLIRFSAMASLSCLI